VRALASNDRDLRLVDLQETQHVAAHGVHCQHAGGPCGKTPTLVYLGNGGEDDLLTGVLRLRT
jgi:hypothetical protein